MTRSLLVIFLFSLSVFSRAQLYQGPEPGSVPSGAAVSTTSFGPSAPVSIEPAPVRNKIPFHFPENIHDLYKSSALSSALQFDEAVAGPQSADIDSTILLKSFEGIPQTNSIPPDPYVAVGPDHVLAVVNSSFRIYDKNGTVLKTIDANRWFRNVLTDAGPFDPKVIYDHFNQRWVMVWLNQSDEAKSSHLLISVSDDSDPTGEWYNWAIRGNVNGSIVVDNWSDYQGVGFDNQALYITSNQWSFGGEYQYSKIRIIDKAQLYSSTPGQLDWLDIWNIKSGYPNGQNSFGIRPVRMYGEPGAYYFVSRSPYSPGNYFVVHQLTNPLTSPEIITRLVNVAPYYSPELANQLGGSRILIETGNSNLYNEPVYRDGMLYLVHTVRSGSQNQFSSLRFVSVDMFSFSAVQDITIGAEGFWYYYAAIDVDKDHNVLLTYSRSGYTEYPGAFYMYKSVNSNQFKGSRLLQRGLGNYVKDFDSNRNRWGDYNGIWVDPADHMSVWVMTEYSAGKDIWGTKIGRVQLRPFQKAFASKSDSLIDFGNHHIGTSSDTAEIIIRNLGYEDLQLTGVSNSRSEFKLLNLPVLPQVLKTFDSLVIKVTFSTEELGEINDAIILQSNSSYQPETKIDLTGFGYIITAAEKGVVYGSTGLASGGSIIKIDPAAGTGTLVGKTGFTAVSALTINPKLQHIYGLFSSGGNSKIIRANADKGDAYEVVTLPLELTSAAYDNEAVLYAVSKNNRLYRINDSNGDSVFVAQLGIPVASITFNPSDGHLWASVNASSTVKDLIYKINKNTGDTTRVGSTGLGKVLNALTFDNNGNLYGAFGTSLQISTLVKIDPANASAVQVGPIGFKGITGLAVANMTTDVDEKQISTVPKEFSLKQNYPNPFNPNTMIEYSLPFDSNVRLSIYNLIGEEIRVLQSGNNKAGSYKINWDATDSNGKKLSSGIYIYRIIASGAQGEYKDSRKMILLK